MNARASSGREACTFQLVCAWRAWGRGRITAGVQETSSKLMLKAAIYKLSNRRAIFVYQLSMCFFNYLNDRLIAQSSLTVTLHPLVIRQPTNV